MNYTWKWEPNRLGKDFDASGNLVQSFTTLGPGDSHQIVWG